MQIIQINRKPSVEARSRHAAVCSEVQGFSGAKGTTNPDDRLPRSQTASVLESLRIPLKEANASEYHLVWQFASVALTIRYGLIEARTI